MATISNTPRPGYAWDATDNCWYPIGTGPHTHSDYITQSTAINPTIVDAKGDIITATAADTPARLAVGTDGQALLADSTTSTGLKWGSASPALNEQIFTSSGTWTAPAGVTKVWALIVSGGGGGGGGGNGPGAPGAGGGQKQIQVSVTPGSSYTVTIGAGGASPGSSPWSGGSEGGQSSFNGITADGGRGGAGSAMRDNETSGGSAYGQGGAPGSAAAANKGGGGASYQVGGSGIVVVRWLG